VPWQTPLSARARAHTHAYIYIERERERERQKGNYVNVRKYVVFNTWTGMFQMLVFYTVSDIVQVYAVDAGGPCLGNFSFRFCNRHFLLVA
jgi:hypothetical protein